jgi:Bacterial protein of unknown function (DUF898)
MRNTFYGDLGGGFVGSGLRLFLRGLPMWIAIVAPIAVTVGAFIEVVNFPALAEALAAGGNNLAARIESSNPQFADVLVFAMLMGGTSVGLGALLYPAFQALMLRWWSSGIRFGEIGVQSTLRTLQVYGAYVRFLWYGILFSILAGIVGGIGLFVIGAVVDGNPSGTGGEIAATAVLLVGYVFVALGYSTVYRATVLLSLWQLGMESLQLSGLSALERVKAAGGPSSALGEGMADALNVGGY